MARNPTPRPTISREFLIGTPVNPKIFKDFKASEESKKPAQDLRLSEYIAAVRREIEAVALIAAPQDREVPNFHVADVELELVCAVSEVSDEGLRVTVNKESLADTPESLLQKVKIRLTDPDIIQLENMLMEKKSRL